MKYLSWLLFSCIWWGVASAQVDDANRVGRIAYVGTDYNVYTLAPDGESTALTDDAQTEGDLIRQYGWPTWSSDDRLAYFLTVQDAAEQRFSTEVYVSADGTSTGELTYTGDREVFNYAYWAPGNCADGDNCRALAVLLSSPGTGLFVELIKDRLEEPSSEQAGRGGPFYYSFSPNGQQMLWQRNNRRLDIYDVDSGAITTSLDQSPGAFQAPDWSPVDDRLLFGKLDRESRSTDIVIVDGESERLIVDDLDGIVYFAWSPDGEKFAYTSQQGPLLVVDAETGETLARSSTTGVLSFFWSPDSSKLAYITVAVPDDAFTAGAGVPAAMVQRQVGLAWSVLDVEADSVDRYSPFVPTPNMVYMFVYFDQFAQSHQVWSPDSRHIVYGELVNDDPIISLLDTTQPGVPSVTIADGFVGIWSYN